MEIVVHDDIAEMEALFVSTAHPREKFAEAQRTLLTPDRLGGRVGRLRDDPTYAVMEAARQDGYDVVAAQQVWGLFNPARSPKATA